MTPKILSKYIIVRGPTPKGKYKKCHYHNPRSPGQYSRYRLVSADEYRRIFRSRGHGDPEYDGHYDEAHVSIIACICHLVNSEA